MRQRQTEKPTLGVPAVPLPDGVRVVGAGKTFELGEAHVAFALDDSAPGATVTICLGGGRMVGMAMTGEVTSRALHRVPLRALERFALAHVRYWSREYRDPSYVEATSEEFGRPAAVIAAEVEPLASAFETAATVVERTGTREQYLAGLAARYVALCGLSGTPTKTLAEECHLSAATVRDQLGQARERGLLTKPGSGRAGGDLTPKAAALLDGTEATSGPALRAPAPVRRRRPAGRVEEDVEMDPRKLAAAVRRDPVRRRPPRQVADVRRDGA